MHTIDLLITMVTDEIAEETGKDGTEDYRRTPETVTMEIHFNLKSIPELGTIKRGSGSHKLENLLKFNLF